MYLYIDKGKYGHNTLYVAKSYRNEKGRNTTKIVERLGRLEELKKIHEDPIEWAKGYIEELNAKEAEEIEITLSYRANSLMEMEQDVLFNGGYLYLQKIFYDLKLDKICHKITKKYDFKYNLTEILCVLVFGRILSPKSKAATYEECKKDIEERNIELQSIYRALEVIAKEKDFIQSELYKNSLDVSVRKDKILYYDCTNYYFEIEREKGLRKYGVSKEHRPNPIVEMGMFIDGSGIPLAFCISPGNTNEQKTLLPLEQQIIRDFEHSKFVVCTDAGLSSVSNRRFNNVGQRAFITAQSIKKMKAHQKEWALSPYGWRLAGRNELYNLDDILSSEELSQKYRLSTFYKENWFNENDIEQRYIVTFSLKYMNYQRNIRNEQVDRARKALVSENKNERHRQSDFKRFIQKLAVSDNGEVATRKVYVLNEDKIDEEERYDGFYAVATNLEDEAPEIIRINSKRWEIEESFRIMKTEFSSRPVYLSRDDRISAHFTTCFLALTIFRYLEHRLGHKYTCSDILNNLKNIKFHKTKEGFIPLYSRNEFTEDIHRISRFRTDYQIIPFSNMKKIIKASKSQST